MPGHPTDQPTDRATAETADVVVVGAGVIGAAIAWEAARAGLAVALVDDRPARGASWAAAGMLAPATEAHYGEEALLRLNLASSARWPSFAAELEDDAGRPAGYRPNGTLVVARDPDDVRALEHLEAFHRRLGLATERLTSRECRRLEPGLSPTIRGGLLAEADHQVDNRLLVEALLAAATRRGVARVERRAAALRRDGDRVTGVTLDDGRTVAAPAVVLAAGWASSRLDGVPPGSVPVRPVKGQLLHLRPPASGPAAPLLAGAPLATRNLRVVAGRPARPPVYVVPRADGRVVVGATAEEAGPDTTVTAGAVLDLLREAYELLPGIAELELAETVAGLRPGTPDNAPLLGPGPLEGLVLATGHFRNGILLAPVTADVVVTLLTTGEVPVLAAPFHPARFAAAHAPEPAEVSA